MKILNFFSLHFQLRPQFYVVSYLRNTCGGYNPPQFAALWPSH